MLGATLEQAIQKHQQGQLTEAVGLYRQVLQQQPGNLDALRLMSMLSGQLGDWNGAMNLAQQAINLKPNKAELHLNLADILLSTGQTDAAITAIQKAIKIDRRNLDAYLALGDAYQQKKEYDAAIAQYQKALQLDRSVPETYNNMANALLACGKPNEAIQQYQKAISLRHAYPEAHFNLGNAYRQMEQYDLAIQAYHTALALNPRFYQAYTMLGVAYKAAGSIQEAQAAYQKALTLLPPTSQQAAVTLYNLGNLYQDLRQFDQAIACFEQSLAIQPANPGAMSNMAISLSEQGCTEEAIQIYSKLAEQIPDYTIHRLNAALQLPVIYQNQSEIAQWRHRLEAAIDSLLQSDLNPIDETSLNSLAATGFYLAYQGQADRLLQEKIAQVFHKALGTPQQHLNQFLPLENRKAKIGFVSRHFSAKHTIGKFMQGIIHQLSRNQFDVVVFSIGSENPYQQTGQEQADDRFYELSCRDLSQARQAIQAESPDILFYADLGMDPFTYLLAHHRLAPVQCVTWGHPVTTGLNTIDYFLSSRLIEPNEAQAHYTEQLVLLENLPTYYYRPPTEGITADRAAFGFETSDHLYLCPQSLFKLHPDFDAIIRGILERDPQGKVILLSHYSDAVNQLLLKRFQHNMPEGVVERIRFLPRLGQDQFMHLLACADVMLDPLHFGGGNTTYEALALGVPIVHWPGEFMRGRVTTGCYQKMQVSDCIVHSAQAYIELAVRLGTDATERARISQRILQTHAVLYEDRAVITELEQFFLNALQGAKGAYHA
jgi:protein O-GlcNAc transferase